MPTDPNDSPGSGLDKPPTKSLAEKISDTVRAIIKPSSKIEKDNDSEGKEKDAK